jgi:hypothetical protein
MTSALENSYDQESKKVLIALALTNTPVPLGYITYHTGINEPLPLVERLEDEGLVHRCPSSRWSCSQGPRFEVHLAIRKELWTYL